MKKDEIKRAAGRREENRVFEAVSRLPELSIYRDLYVPCGRGGRTSQLDLVLLCNKGVWVTEVKSHSGQITGSARSWEWRKEFKPPAAKSKQVMKFLNPLRQVRGQMASLSRYLGLRNEELNGLVVFSSRAKLKVPSRAENCVVLQTPFVASHLRRSLASREACFTLDELSRLEQRLDVIANASDGTKRLHIIHAQQAERARKDEQERRRAARQKPRSTSKAPKL